MADRTAQVSFFALLAVIVVLIAGLAIYLANSSNYFKKNDVLEINPDSKNIVNFIEACIKETASNGIYFTALQGGYFDAPPLSKEFFFIHIPYYWHLETNKMPEKEIIEKELSKFIESQLPSCLNNFTSLKQIGYSIEDGKITAYSKINFENVVVKVNYPVRIKNKNGEQELSNFISTTEIDFSKKFGLVQEILAEQKKDPNSIPLGFLAELAYKNNFTFEYIYMGEGDVIYSLIFKEKLNKTLVYAYAAKYNWTNATQSSQPVIINPIPEFNLTKPAVINYKVNASGDNLTFYDYTNLFDINPKTGFINFDAFDVPNGNYNILIKAVDGKGSEALAIMRVNINYQNKLPIIEPIGNLTAYSGKEFTYKVKATDPMNKFLLFLDDTFLFNINVKTGEIKFIPNSTGNYSIKITAVNDAGASYEFLNLEVK